LLVKTTEYPCLHTLLFEENLLKRKVCTAKLQYPC